MAIPTVAVFISVEQFSAAPLTGGRVIFEATAPAIVGAIVVAPEPIETLLADDGTATAQLTPSPAGTGYLVTVRDAYNRLVVSGYAIITGACNLADVIQFPASAVTAAAASLFALGQPGGAALVGLSMGLAHEQPMTVQDYARGEAVNGLKFLTPAERASVLARDGRVNVTASVAYATAACAGKTLYWPPGRYVMDTMVVNAGLRVVGVPGATVFERSQTVAIGQDFWTTDSSLAPVRSVKNLEIYGIVFDGGSRAPQRWLQLANGAPCTDAQADYYDAVTNPGGKIGNPAFPLWTIADTVAAGRRNPNYTQVATLLRLSLVDGGDLRMCLFQNHKGRAVSEQGGRNVTIAQCGLDGVAKNDGAYHAIYTQSYGTPGGGQSFYSPSENIRIVGNWARNLERSFCAFMPTKGGECSDNYVDGWQESCIFISPSLNVDGGHATVRGNVFKNGVVSDIVCWGIEAGSAQNLRLENNWIENSQLGGISIPGASNVRATDNTTKDIGLEGRSYPYGPFSERYAFAVGSAPIAGKPIAITSTRHVEVGSQGANGGSGNLFRDHVWRETRTLGAYPYCVAQTKSGNDNIAAGVTFDGGSVQIPAGMSFLDVTIGNVWQANMPFRLRNINGHASEAPAVAIKFYLSAATGVKTVDVGFRPRLVEVYANQSGVPGAGMSMVGAFSWNAAATRNNFVLSHSSQNGVGQYDAIDVNEVISLYDATGAMQFRGNFLAWTETGFTLNVVQATIGAQVQFVCHP